MREGVQGDGGRARRAAEDQIAPGAAAAQEGSRRCHVRPRRGCVGQPEADEGRRQRGGEREAATVIIAPTAEVAPVDKVSVQVNGGARGEEYRRRGRAGLHVEDREMS